MKANAHDRHRSPEHLAIRLRSEQAHRAENPPAGNARDSVAVVAFCLFKPAGHRQSHPGTPRRIGHRTSGRKIFLCEKAADLMIDPTSADESAVLGWHRSAFGDT